MVAETAAAAAAARVFAFPEGLIGLPEVRQFVLEPFPGLEGIAWYLKAADGSGLEFLVLNPEPFFPRYRPELPPGDLAALGSPAPEERAILVIATVPEDVRRMTANLRAPVVLNVTRRLGRQVLLAGDEYEVRTPVFALGAVASNQPGGLVSGPASGR
ncbi:MAG: flagellar assembly protein FliW [Firmicutes bacterium]|nr:flagellar assembly protein FliW [Bacillota bacterium]